MNAGQVTLTADTVSLGIHPVPWRFHNPIPEVVIPHGVRDTVCSATRGGAPKTWDLADITEILEAVACFPLQVAYKRISA